MLLKTKKLNFKDEQINRLQDNITTVLDDVTRISLLNGLQITNVQLLAGQDNAVLHKLGRELLGYFITRKRAQSEIWDSQDANNIKSKLLILNCSADVSVDLWVY